MREKLIEILRKPIFPHELVDPIEAVADYLLDSGVTVQEWIPVTERLPFAEYGESNDVLAVTELDVIRVLYFDGGNWCFQNGECCPHKVTHWMPLPTPPKEG